MYLWSKNIYYIFSDRLQVILYKDVSESVKEDAKPKSVFCLDAFFGLNTDFNYDKETYVLAIVCHKNITFMAFEQREKMIEFEINIRQSLGEGMFNFKSFYFYKGC